MQLNLRNPSKNFSFLTVPLKTDSQSALADIIIISLQNKPIGLQFLEVPSSVSRKII